ncbi:MAG: helix-turn-helix domain-containing protein [Clostridia bacterium]|nr:helix-turn-helix domain-containing protein [Clostridia bacterium]
MQERFTFGEILKELRLERHVNQVALAQAIGVSKGIISLWENGLREPTLTNLIALAKYFDVSIDYLAGLSD